MRCGGGRSPGANTHPVDTQRIALEQQGPRSSSGERRRGATPAGAAGEIWDLGFGIGIWIWSWIWILDWIGSWICIAGGRPLWPRCACAERAAGAMDWIGLDWIGLDWTGLDCTLVWLFLATAPGINVSGEAVQSRQRARHGNNKSPGEERTVYMRWRRHWSVRAPAPCE